MDSGFPPIQCSTEQREGGAQLFQTTYNYTG